MSDASDIVLGGRAPQKEARAPHPFRRSGDMAWPYLRGAGLSVTLIWVFVISYLALTPASYVSRWTMNVPGATSSVSVSLESIGQTNSTPSSPFSSSSLSPKVVYKEIADGEKVRLAAAQSLGLTLQQFGKPRVKLVDETALILFEMAAPSPQEAQRRGDALIKSFNAELDRLRSDELDKREGAVRRNLSAYQQQAKVARENMIRAQTETGLISTNQFAEMVTGLTNLRKRLPELASEISKAEDEQARLVQQLGTTPKAAGVALRLAADPSLQKVLQEYAEAAALFATDDARFGVRHPQRLASLNRRDAALQRFSEVLGRLGGGSGAAADIEQVAMVTNSSARSDLYATLVRNDAALEGKRREWSSLTHEKERLEVELSKLGPGVARLEELKKEQLVADAVLGSALARLDSSKSDIFGSYPIVQVVSTPDVAEIAAQPRPLYAALGGISGSFFACLAWILAWLQSYHRWKLRKNDSSSG